MSSCRIKEKEHYQSIIARIRAVTGTRTQTELAALLGIRQSSISDAKKRNTIPADWILTFFRKLGVNPDWLETGTGPTYLRTDKGYEISEDCAPVALEHLSDPQASPVVVPVYSTQCRWEEGESPESDTIGRLALPRSHAGEHLRVYRMDSDALAPLVHKGAYVGVDTTQRHPISGEIFAVTVPPEGVLFRRLWSQGNPSDKADANQCILCAEQSSYPDVTLNIKTFRERIVGRLAWSFQTYR